MRTISAADDALFTAPGGRATFLRVDTQDSGATWRDLTTYLGQNFVTSATWSDGVDDPGQHGTLMVKREVEQLSLSPFMQGSPANLAFAYPGSYAPLLYIGRGLRIYTADIPEGQQPTSGDWRLMFEGKIDKVDPAADENDIQVQFSDFQGALRDAFIEVERVYSFAQGLGVHKGCRIWSALAPFTLNEILIPTDANRNGHFYNATTAGTVSSSAAEPAFPTSPGGTVVDGGETWQEVGTTSTTAGTAVETVIAQIAADNGVAVTVNTPGGSPGWLIKWFLQQRQSVWDGVRALADQIGWDLRYQFDSGSGTFKLNLWTPNRSKTTPDRTFAASQKIHVQGLAVDISKIRNAVEVVFSASGSADPSGNPLRISIGAITDPTSIAKYGRRYMLIAEGSTSNIDTTAEATAMANAALSDLKEPTAETQVELPYFPFVELGDLYRFSPDAVYSDANLDLAVVGYQHTLTADGITTTLTCRGKPSTGCDRWLAMDTRVAFDDAHQLSGADSDAVTIAAKQVVGGTLLTASAVQNKNAWGQDFEWHVGTTAGFTPDTTTVIQSQGGNQVTVPHLIPNKAYFAKIVPVRRNDRKPFRGQPSAGFGFTAGRASSGHMNEGIALGDMPLNGGFETWLDPSGPPDHWTVLNGVWGVDMRVINDADGVSGANYLFFSMNSTPAVLTKMRSAIIPLINDDEANTGLRLTTRYLLDGWVRTDAFNSGGNHLLITAAGVDYQGNLIGLMGGSGVITVAATSNPGKWQYVQALVHCDGFPTMKGVYIVIQTDTAGTLGLSNYYIDELRLRKVQSPWYIVNQTTKFTDNYQSLPPFNGAWVADVTVPAFRRDAWGYIELKGSVKNGVIGTSAFTLPVGFRPAELKRMPLISAFNTPGEMDITTAGLVTPATGNNGWVSLDGFRFWPYL